MTNKKRPSDKDRPPKTCSTERSVAIEDKAKQRFRLDLFPKKNKLPHSQILNNYQIEDWLSPNYHFNEVNSQLSLSIQSVQIRVQKKPPQSKIRRSKD